MCETVGVLANGTVCAHCVKQSQGQITSNITIGNSMSNINQCCHDLKPLHNV